MQLSTLEQMRVKSSHVVIVNLWVFFLLGFPVGYFSVAGSWTYWAGMAGMLIAAVSGTLYLRQPKLQQATEYVIPLLYFLGGGMLIVASGGVNHTVIDPLYISFGVLGFAATYCSPKTMVLMIIVGFSHHAIYQIFWPTGLYAEGLNLIRFGWHGVWWSVIGFSSLVAGGALQKVLVNTDAAHAEMIRTVSANQVLEQEKAQAEFKRIEETQARDREKQETETKRIETEEQARATAETVRQNEFALLASEFERNIFSMLEEVSETSKQLQTLTEGMSKSVKAVQNASDDTLKLTQQSLAATEAVACATEELSTSISNIREQSHISRDTSATARTEIEASASSAEELQRSANTINNVTGTIQALSSKTNLLALNATIEAASAGQAGAGFAIVASEVKSLAQQTDDATDEIKGQVEAVGQNCHAVVETIDHVCKRMIEVESAGQSVADAVAQQDSATMEIVTRTQETAKLGHAVGEQMQTMSAQIESAKDAAAFVSDSSGKMLTRIEAMHSNVSKFLTHIRSNSGDAGQSEHLPPAEPRPDLVKVIDTTAAARSGHQDKPSPTALAS